MKISKQALADIFVGCGFKGAQKWSAQRFEAKMKDLVGSIEEGFSLDDEKLQAKLEKLIAAVNAEEEIEIVEGKSKSAAEEKEEKPAKTDKKKDKKKSSKKAKAEEAEEEESDEEEEEGEEKPARKSSKKKPAAKKTTEKKPAGKANAKTSKKKPAAAKKSEGRDRFGNRVGTGASVINSALGKKPKTVADIAAETKEQPQRVRAHLMWLEEREYVTNTDKGWKVTGTTA